LLGSAVAESGASILATGATGVGKSFYAGALNYLTAVDCEDIPKRCVLTQMGSSDPASRRKNREAVLKGLSACIFIGGGNGTWEEYEIVKNYGALCLPVGVSGGTAQRIWEECSEQWNNHPSRDVRAAYAALGSSKSSHTEIIQAILSILQDCDTQGT
jgi:hypothetical protein